MKEALLKAKMVVAFLSVVNQVGAIMNKIKLEQFLATIPMQNKTDVELILQQIKDNQQKGMSATIAMLID